MTKITKTLLAGLVLAAAVAIPATASRNDGQSGDGDYELRPAGTVASFSAPKLTVDLSDDGPVTGTVSRERTEIFCFNKGDKLTRTFSEDNDGSVRECGVEALNPGRKVLKAEMWLVDGEAYYSWIGLGAPKSND